MTNLSPMFENVPGRKVLFMGHANGPSHKKDWTKNDEWPTDLPSRSADPATSRIYHSSYHAFQPGDIVNPTMSKTASAIEQGLYGTHWDEEDEHPTDREWYNSEGMLQPQAWASFHPLAASNPRKFEVEPLKNDVEVDPHATDTNEMVSPTGFRVVQEVTPRNK